MEPQVEFIGWQLKPKQEISIAEELEEDSLVTIHITQLALGDAADNSRHTVFITNDKGKFAIGTLDRDRPHFSVDFMAAEADLKLSHTGTSDVYVTGYKTTSSILPGQYPYFDGEDTSDEDEDEDEEDEPPPQAVPLNSKRRAALIAPSAQLEAEDEEEDEDEDDEDFDEQERLLDAQEFSELEEDDDEEEEEEEEDDDDDEDDDDEALMGQAAAGVPNGRGMGISTMEDEDEDDDDEDDEEDEEDDEDDMMMDDQKLTSAAIKRQFAAQKEEDEDDDADEDDEDETEELPADEFGDDEDDDEDEDEDDESAAMPNIGGKRSLVPKTPQPAKKAKVELKEPKSAPAKMQKGGHDAGEFQAKVISVLKDKGPLSLSALGGIVKRPPGAPKMKKFLEDNTAFKITGDSVSLA